jgi:hypothetical protein
VPLAWVRVSKCHVAGARETMPRWVVTEAAATPGRANSSDMERWIWWREDAEAAAAAAEAAAVSGVRRDEEGAGGLGGGVGVAGVGGVVVSEAVGSGEPPSYHPRAVRVALIPRPASLGKRTWRRGEEERRGGEEVRGGGDVMRGGEERRGDEMR